MNSGSVGYSSAVTATEVCSPAVNTSPQSADSVIVWLNTCHIVVSTSPGPTEDEDRMARSVQSVRGVFGLSLMGST